MSQDSYEDVVRSSTFKALSEVNDVESAGQILEYFLNGKLHQGRIAAVEALGRLRKSDDHFADELLIAQGFPDARVRAETASVIEAVGSERNLDSLRKWLNQEPEGRVRRRIREAIFSIESKSASPASQGTLMS